MEQGMNVKGAKLVYYSPTGSSRKIAEAVAGGLGMAHGGVDLTGPGARPTAILGCNDLTVIAVPVYGGRVPVTAAERLKTVRGEGSPAVLVVVYGNRAFEDALVELKDIATEQGFRPVAAATFVAEHSFSTGETPVAHGRPDDADLAKATAFGTDVKRKLNTISEASDLFVPGNRPYKERSSPSEGMSPETDSDTCIMCGACAQACPTGAVALSAKVNTVKGLCTRCTACVKSCPTGARAWAHPGIKKIATWLNTSFGERKEPETFL